MIHWIPLWVPHPLPTLFQPVQQVMGANGVPGRPGGYIHQLSSKSSGPPRHTLTHDGSMVLAYMVTFTMEYTPVMLAYNSIYTSTMDPSWVKV